MDDQFYNGLFKYFCLVARRTNPTLASDENLCREIFHERVLFPKRIKSIEQAEAIMRGKGRIFPTPKSYSNWQYTIFKNAINEHLRSEYKKEKRLQGMATDAFEQLPDPQPETLGEERSHLQKRANELGNQFSREEKELLALRYMGRKTQGETGKHLKVSISSISRRETKIKQKLLEALSQKSSELEEKDQLILLDVFLENIAREMENARWDITT